MWLARREREGTAPPTALTGPATLPGDPAGVWLEGERRGVTVYAPGGYHWAPAQGDEVLVLKAGQSGEKPCAVGVPAGAENLAPGEVLITAGKAALRLKLNGTVAVTGKLTVNGRAVLLSETEGE